VPQVINAPSATQTWARDVNNFGVVVGQFEGGGTTRAYAWTLAKGFAILRPGTTDTISDALAINDCGQIAGWVGVAVDAYGHSAIWRPDGSVRYLPELGGPGSDATDINEKGHVAGASLLPVDTSNGNFYYHAYYWSNTAGIIDLGTLGGHNSSAEGINNQDQVVGYSEIAGGAVHAFYWSFNTGMVDIGPVESIQQHGYDINDPGKAVGSATLTTPRAFSWTAPIGSALLNSVGTQSSAYGINKSGQIVGEGRDSSNARRAIAWSPGGGKAIIDASTGKASVARKISDNGVVVGDATITVNFVPKNRAVVWSPTPAVTHPPPPEMAYCGPL
jgi:probable HAF family extracellular repeat protein